MTRWLSLLVILAAAAVGAAAFLFADKPYLDVELLVTGVFQGNVDPFAVAVKETGTEELRGGLAFLKTRLDRLRAAATAAGARPLTLSVGDDLPGTSSSFYTQGRVVVEAMNQLGLDLQSIGNREFDFGPALFEKRAREAAFPVVCANALKPDGTPHAHLKPFIIKEMDGLRIGLTGMAPPTTPEESKPENIAGYHFEDEAWVAANVIPAMRKAGADLVVVVTQRDIAKEMAFIRNLAGAADVAIAFDYYHQATTPVAVGGLLVVPYFGLSKGEEVTACRLRVDKTTRAVTPLALGFSRVGPRADPPDNGMARLLSEAARRIDRIKGRVIGRATAKLVRPYDNTTDLGNYVCDLMLAAATAEVAIQNSGSFRADLPAGAITVGMVYDILPFDNDLIVMDLAGADLRATFEKAVAERRGLIQIAGGRYACVETAPKSWRLGTLEVAGAPVDPARVYRVATNDFMAGGGGGYPLLKNGTRRRNLGRLRQVVSDAIERAGSIQASGEARLTVEK